MPSKYSNENEINGEFVFLLRDRVDYCLIQFLFFDSVSLSSILFLSTRNGKFYCLLYSFIKFETQTRCKIILQLGMENPLQIELQEFSELLNYSQPNSPG